MGDPDQANNVKKLRSCHTSIASEKSSSQAPPCRSDANIYYDTMTGTAKTFTKIKNTRPEAKNEYYEKYEHDKVPVKDDSSFYDNSFSEDTRNDLRSVDKDSITNSDLDKLEMKLLSKISQELQTNEDDTSSLDSNIKLFRTTVQRIFDSFYENMQDFELYKKKFQEILEKNKGDAFSEMEDFIIDMIQNIEPSKSLLPNKEISHSTKDDARNKCSKDFLINVNDMYPKAANNSVSRKSTVQTFLNGDYLTDSTLEGSSKLDSSNFKTEETYNIYLLSGNPSVQIKMKNRDMMSEINIRDKNIEGIENQLASAENIKMLAAKKLQIKNKLQEQAKLQEFRGKDRDIPVKISSVKKNIHLDEDFACEDKQESKSIIFKICSYICRKFRKNTTQ